MLLRDVNIIDHPTARSVHRVGIEDAESKLNLARTRGQEVYAAETAQIDAFSLPILVKLTSVVNIHPGPGIGSARIVTDT